MNILVTGGAGYVGSHTCVELLRHNYNIIIVDNLSNSSMDAVEAIKKLSGKDFRFYEKDLIHLDALDTIFEENRIDAVLHFAGYKAVGESVTNPLIYYQNNITGTLNLLELMSKYQVKKFVFSSSATVYGINNPIPYVESMPLLPESPYGWTKMMIEQILRDYAASENDVKVALLRYFNPIGADSSGLLGERPTGIPNNLMPYICQVAQGKIEFLNIYGNNYKTIDGTGVRDYIHVYDLVKGHLKALEKLEEIRNVEAYNLGTGRGTSVLELITAFEKASGIKIPYKISSRRPGDIGEYYADITKASEELNWRPEFTLEDMCLDSWNFISKKN
jgi:UDP-glucose 4-epimerase